MLCAPAVIVMLAVTAYPIVYAFVLSLQKLDLRFPEQTEFIGLANYGTVLSSELWWLDVFNTLLIMVISVSIELVLGMAIALVMHRAIFGRGVVRTVVLIPYGIITVVAAFAWQFAFASESGFVDNLPLHRRRKKLVRRPHLLARRDHHGRDLENDAVHGAAAAGRPGDDRRTSSTRRRRSTAPPPGSASVKITLPLMKPAILVAVLFRTLEASRVFDSIFIMTRGAQNTESVSILGFDQLINRLNLGLGSAISVLIFLGVVLIAFLFIKGLLMGSVVRAIH